MRQIEQRAYEAYITQFHEDPALVASAPGRVNLIGEHTDYNGGFVLPCAIDLRVAIAIGAGNAELYSVDFDELRSPVDGRARAWVDYPSGVAWALRERGCRVPSFRCALAGDVPRGSGLSSSAAIEAATALALDALFNLGLDRKELAQLCQRAENVFVGVQSGIMDQYASLLCIEDMALLIDCRTLDAKRVPLDLDAAGLTLLVCDTRVSRELGATGYNDRRAACEGAARTLGVRELRDARIEDMSRLSGEALKRARHVVTENARVLEAVDALGKRDFAAFGKLMYDSHRSLRDDYQVSTRELDAFVDLAMQSGSIGARLTGAGFGGCAIALLKHGEIESLERSVVEHFSRHHFTQPRFYTFHPSAGAEVV